MILVVHAAPFPSFQHTVLARRASVLSPTSTVQRASRSRAKVRMVVLRKLQQKRAAKRVDPGDGRALQGFKWWQLPGRALFHLRAADPENRHTIDYAVDVRHWQNQSSGGVKADLYCDGTQVATSKIPAAFAIEGGSIEVAMSGVGMKRCHFVTDDGRELPLRPDPASAEGRRARLDGQHPTASRVIGFVSVFMLLIGLVLLALQLLAPISQIPPIAESVDSFTSPVDLPVWLNIALGVGAAVGSIERSLRLRYHWLLDGAGN
ncbi:MAG: hypothetical protein QME72_02515 [Rhodococcus sp. (in: high G+C Gram-positive bacteria)]|nr:hypothetical protein [Rhodococcus sp. (in: high G+C Gram-positive bacteria)]MDI6626574.1 hypothetical protein [Rhodococcus sp. (in: high G+C Gram-positive bacteria)]